MGILLTHIIYNIAIIFLVFRELVNVLHNYCFHIENMLHGALFTWTALPHQQQRLYIHTVLYASHILSREFPVNSLHAITDHRIEGVEWQQTIQCHTLNNPPAVFIRHIYYNGLLLHHDYTFTSGDTSLYHGIGACCLSRSHCPKHGIL